MKKRSVKTDWTVRIVNPELIPQVCENMTQYAIDLYNEGEINIPKRRKEN